MHVAICTRSPSVRRALEIIILAAGHQLADAATPPELALVDGLHPPLIATPLGCPTLTLVEDVTAHDHEIHCPLSPHHLLQRLMAYRQTQPIALSNGWALDALARTVKHPAHASLSLTEKECNLLATLAGAHPHPLGRTALLAQVWGVGSDVDTHTLETHIYRLRTKLGSITPPVGDIVTEDGAYQWIRPQTVIKL